MGESVHIPRSAEQRAFLDYLGGLETEDGTCEWIDDNVADIKYNEGAEDAYMTIEEYMEDEIEFRTEERVAERLEERAAAIAEERAIAIAEERAVAIAEERAVAIAEKRIAEMLREKEAELEAVVVRKMVLNQHNKGCAPEMIAEMDDILLEQVQEILRSVQGQ